MGLDSQCNTGCGCDTAVYDPVCANGVQYFSPCHAGCSEPHSISDEEMKVLLYGSIVSQSDQIRKRQVYRVMQIIVYYTLMLT